MSWFSELSKTQQATYLKNHPNSKYAKSKSKASSTSRAKKVLYKSEHSGKLYDSKGNSVSRAEKHHSIKDISTKQLVNIMNGKGVSGNKGKRYKK